jgi:hypothetical protein
MLCFECLDDETLAWQTISIFAPAQLGKKTGESLRKTDVSRRPLRLLPAAVIPCVSRHQRKYVTSAACPNKEGPAFMTAQYESDSQQSSLLAPHSLQIDAERCWRVQGNLFPIS